MFSAREAELLEHGGAGRRGAEAVEAEHVAAVADPAPPAHARPWLDREPRRDRRGQHLLAVVLALLFEQLHAGHRDDARAVAFARRAPSRPPASSPTSAPVEIRISSGSPPGRVPQHVAAAQHALGGRDLVAVEHLDVLAREQQRDRAVLAFERDRATRAPSRSRRPGGSPTACGIARSAAKCSIGWWVGPSSPRPTESCVQTHSDRQLHQRRQAHGAAHVVGEHAGTSSRRA